MAVSDKNEIEAKIVDQNSDTWHFEVLETKENLDNLFFVNQNTVFANNSSEFTTSFYKSINGGKSWNKISVLQNYYVNDIFFHTPTEGFALVYNASSKQSKNSDKNCIMKTRDGGITWDKTFSSDINSFDKITINNAGIGVVVGRKSLSTFEASNSVLLTSDFGKTWKEVSENLNHSIQKINGQISDYLADGIIFNDRIIVLSISGRISQTSNFGNSWETISELKNEPPQTLIQNLGLQENGGFWLSGGANSTEGTWGVIAINKSKTNWERYRLDNYYFSDVKFITDNEVIAVGSLVSSNNFGGIDKQDTGIILYSTDSGKNWSIAYSSQTVNRFNSIIKLSKQKFYVVGSNGINGILEKK